MRKTLTKLVVLFVVTLPGFSGLVDHLHANDEDPAYLSARDSANAANIGADDPWSPEEIMQPEELARLLSGEHKPAVVQIGIIHLYKIGHIPGSKYAGPASAAEGVDALKKEAQGIDRNSPVVYYCGCCPWGDCPNTRPAYKALREMGFKKIRVLYLPKSFGQDWVMKGFPVEKSGS